MAPGTPMILVLLLIIMVLDRNLVPISTTGQLLSPQQIVTSVKLQGGHMEVVEQETCSSGVTRLTCRSLRAFLIVLEASYLTNRSSLCNGQEHDQRREKKMLINLKGVNNQVRHLRGNYVDDTGDGMAAPDVTDLRISINRRCSGLQHCRFNVSSDHPEAAFWKPANLRLKYACIPETAITKYCNTKIFVLGGDGGYLKSPGYPLYYTGGTSCGWTFQSLPGQRISLTLHDLNIRSAEQDGRCVDVIRVRENGITLLESCGTAAGVQVLSESNVVTLDLISLSNLYPSRGFLLQYRAIGCPEVKPPNGSYVVNDTGEAKTFLCMAGTVFPDTNIRSKLIRCKNGIWNEHRFLQSCVESSAAILKAERGGTGRYASLSQQPGTGASYIPANGIVERSSDAVAMTVSDTTMDPGGSAMLKPADYVVDIVLPTVLIALLFIGNAIIVYVIFQYRKRKQPSLGDGEEMTLRGAPDGLPHV